MKAEILSGDRKSQIGTVLTIIDSEGDDVVVVEFEDDIVESFDSKDVKITHEPSDQIV